VTERLSAAVSVIGLMIPSDGELLLYRPLSVKIDRQPRDVQMP
jgi:hypothetical protein